MTNQFTLRSLNFDVPAKELDYLRQTTRFRDVVAVGTLLNAVTFAHERGVPYELAKFAVDRNITGETIYLTGGLLFEGLELANEIVKRYPREPCGMEFENLLFSFTDYKPPVVLIDARFNGPFQLNAEKRGTFKVSGTDKLFVTLERDVPAVAIAKIVNTDDVTDDHKRGLIDEVHTSLEGVVDCLVDDFTLGCEEFIYTVCRQLGLKNPTRQDMGLAL